MHPDDHPHWSTVFCPEMNEGLHDPIAVRILPLVSLGQTEVELEVRCRYCGQHGLSTLELTYESVYSADPPKPKKVEIVVKEGASCTPSSGFWYALFEGGYVKPDTLLAKGAKEVNDAVKVVKAFQEALEEADAIEEM